MTLAAMLLLVAIGFCAGGFGALAGVGGGIIVTPMLAIYFGLADAPGHWRDAALRDCHLHGDFFHVCGAARY